jgi:hypothetical protein
MDENLFEKYKDLLEEEGIESNTKLSQEWFYDRIREINKLPVDRQSIIRNPPIKMAANQFIGRMYLFRYNPVGKQELPYYDRFPLVIMISRQKEGFTGLNLHYLPIDLRQRLFYNLLSRASNTEFRWNTYLKIDYDYLKSRTQLRAHKACIKRYRYDQIYGRIANVPAPEWEVAVHLPLASWRKAGEGRVFKDSREIARKR